MDKPARISLLWSFSSNSALLPGNHLAVEIVELPGEVNSYMTCLACCVESGCIAVGMGSIVRIFTLTAPGEDLESMEGRRPSSSTGYLSSEWICLQPVNPVATLAAVSRAPTPRPDSAHTCKIRRSIWLCKCAMY